MFKYTIFALALAAVAFAVPTPLGDLGSVADGNVIRTGDGLVEAAGGMAESAVDITKSDVSVERSTNTLTKRAGGVSTVTADIRTITMMSRKLNKVVSEIGVVTVLFNGPRVANGFRGIAQMLPTAVSHLAGMKPLGNPDATLVVDALTTFVKVHQNLLSAVISKHGVLATFGFAEPIRLALVALEAAVNNYAFALIALIPTMRSQGMGAQAMLDGSIEAAVRRYS